MVIYIRGQVIDGFYRPAKGDEASCFPIEKAASRRNVEIAGDTDVSMRHQDHQLPPGQLALMKPRHIQPDPGLTNELDEN
jgi:hypothetical protein